MFFLAFSLVIAPWLIVDFLHFNSLPFSTGGGLHLSSKVEKMKNIEDRYIQHLVGNVLGDFFAQKLYPNYDQKEVRLGWQSFKRYYNWIDQGKDQAVY